MKLYCATDMLQTTSTLSVTPSSSTESSATSMTTVTTQSTVSTIVSTMTTTESTSSSSPTPTPSPRACPDFGGSYTTMGKTFSIECMRETYVYEAADFIVLSGKYSMQSCMDACASRANCIGIDFLRAAQHCEVISRLSSTRESSVYDRAQLQGKGPSGTSSRTPSASSTATLATTESTTATVGSSNK